MDADATWWWKFKSGSFTTTKTLVLTSGSGTFVVGETVTGGTSGATAVVASVSTYTLYVTGETGTFSAGETVTGGTSSATGSFSSIAGTRLYDGAAGIDSLIWGANQSRDEPLGLRTSSHAMRLDPPLTETGTPEFLYLWGIDSGANMQLACYPIDSSTGETIAYMYYSFTPDFSSGNDADSLDAYYPESVQPALYFGVARLLKQQEGDEEGAEIEEAEMQKVLNRARRSNGQILGESIRVRNPAQVANSLGIDALRRLTIQEGTL